MTFPARANIGRLLRSKRYRRKSYMKIIMNVRMQTSFGTRLQLWDADHDITTIFRIWAQFAHAELSEIRGWFAVFILPTNVANFATIQWIISGTLRIACSKTLARRRIVNAWNHLFLAGNAKHSIWKRFHVSPINVRNCSVSNWISAIILFGTWRLALVYWNSSRIAKRSH